MFAINIEYLSYSWLPWMAWYFMYLSNQMSMFIYNISLKGILNIMYKLEELIKLAINTVANFMWNENTPPPLWWESLTDHEWHDYVRLNEQIFYCNGYYPIVWFIPNPITHYNFRLMKRYIANKFTTNFFLVKMGVSD